MVELASQLTCTGCGCCSAACACHAISMVSMADGFLYPRVDTDRCVSCGACTQMCPVLQKPDMALAAVPETYAAQNTNKGVLAKSTSGGVFSALADCMLARGGMVVAAGYNADMLVVHRCCITAGDIAGLRGSKYVQSAVPRDVFLSIQNALKLDQWVLFVGTPCQAAAVRSLVGYHARLLLCDVICMGVPAPGFWLRYLSWLRSAYRIRSITNYQFRNKRRGWSRPTLCVQVDGSRDRYVKPENDPYSLAFYGHIGLRESCYQCPFKGERRVTDLTVADFWGIEKGHPKIREQALGVSLVLCHTSQGQVFLKSVGSGALSLHEAQLSVAVDGNPMMVQSIDRPQCRDEFCRDSLSLPFSELMTKYHLNRVSFVRKLVRAVRRKLK